MTDEIIPYPTLLANIPTPPPIIYIRGNLCSQPLHISVVGSRKVSSYGIRATKDIVHALLQHEILIVSGLAFGVDTVVHETCINENKPSIAVCAHGLDTIHPITNTNIVHKILNFNGGLVSEFPPGFPPLPHYFPQRNRIISGLAHGTVVIEAQRKSGSLITAFHSMEQNRETFAVPGSIYHKNSEGTNYLIKQGAHSVTSVEDILTEFHLQKSLSTGIARPKLPDLSPSEKNLLNLIATSGTHGEEIALGARSLPQSELHACLTLLELKGLIHHTDGGFYYRT